jgi:sulfite reductase (NADPH) flavoprotein alpha-component
VIDLKRVLASIQLSEHARQNVVLADCRPQQYRDLSLFLCIFPNCLSLLWSAYTMFIHDFLSGGVGVVQEKPTSQEPAASGSLPFGRSVSFDSLSGPTYVTAQLLAQQVAFAFSDKLFTYSPETFDLDVAAREWQAQGLANAHGCTTSVHHMQTRNGAGTIALGYMFSKDFDLSKRHIPQGVLASSASLQFLRPALEQLSLLYDVANPFAAHISAVDYAGSNGGRLITDYAAPMSLAEDLNFGLVASRSTHESQHMALLATLLSRILPTMHIFDGVQVGRETTRVMDVLDQARLSSVYRSVDKTFDTLDAKHIDIEGRAIRLLKAYNEELGTEYGFFEYAGHSSPDTVLVTFGSVESSLAAQVASQLSNEGHKIGAIAVRIYRPFVEEEFLRVLPRSVKNIFVLGQVHDLQAVGDQGVHSILYEDVLATLTFASSVLRSVAVHEFKYGRSQVWTPQTLLSVFGNLAAKPSSTSESLLVDRAVQQYTFLHVDDAFSLEASTSIAQALAQDSSNNVAVSSTYDNLIQGGMRRTDIRKSPKSLESPYSIQAADVLVVSELKLAETIDVGSMTKVGGKIIINLPGVKDDEVEKKLPAPLQNKIADRNLQLYLIDPSRSKIGEGDSKLEVLIMQIAFLRVALGKSESIDIQKLAAVTQLNVGELEKIATDLEQTLRRIEVPKAWSELELDEKDTVELLHDVQGNSFVGHDKEEIEPPSVLRNWQKAAKALIFKEAYNTKPSLRPHLPLKTFTVHVKENRRLTPVAYDRNIFHIEFDLGDSGLKYNIGEALGIHAENDSDEVMEFVKFYGLDPDALVEVASRDSPSVFENRTVYQSLMQNIDIFGRPPKRFYEALAEFASDEKEKKKLLTLSSPEGAKEFQRRAEVDTITFADILREFSSAHPAFQDIVRIVSPMKRREYSIASCQAVTPTSIALMVVLVRWVDPKGRDRFGQATRYLSKLRPGAPVTVSVKPSVMKLPPKSTQPIIMAGLGTGLAPFRAFVQHRAMEKAQGKDIGSVLLYMGSRHQREEYCYGEEWEAYQAAGVITLLGRAFSRDQPQKIYIQDRMRQTMEDIIQAYIKEDGAFYLCGPTWPVPDVTNVLEEAITSHAKLEKKKVDSRKEIERRKDEGRYVLEVY